MKRAADRKLEHRVIIESISVVFGPPAVKGADRDAPNSRSVEKVWKTGGSSVDKRTRKIFFCRFGHEMPDLHCVDAVSSVPSLEAPGARARILAHPAKDAFSKLQGKTVNLHRFEEVINGREYLIEVSSVGRNKWRAQIARTPGGSTGTMPFYGTTPAEAANHLSRWLTIANGKGRPQL